MKISIFDPDAIGEMNFAPGRHMADPEGRVRVPDIDELLLFHYKYMGFEQTHNRHRQLRNGLGRLDIQQGWGHKYSWSAEDFREDWNKSVRRQLIPPHCDVIPRNTIQFAHGGSHTACDRSTEHLLVKNVLRSIEPDIEQIVAASTTVFGWRDGGALTELALVSWGLRPDATIVEIGVFMGRSTVLLAGSRRLRGSGKVHCVIRSTALATPSRYPTTSEH